MKLKHQDEQRKATRYPVMLPVRHNATVIGYSLNMSSNGVGIQINHATGLAVDSFVNLDMEWPAKLDKQKPLLLRLMVRIVRVDGQIVAARIMRHEFRLRGKPLSAEGQRQLALMARVGK